jgi:hypothetical protein
MSTTPLPPHFDAFAYFEAEREALQKHKQDDQVSFEQVLKHWAADGRSEWRREFFAGLEQD